MLGYRHKKALEESRQNECDDEDEWSYKLNEKIHKVYRSHRDTLSFDSRFIDDVVKECIGVHPTI